MNDGLTTLNEQRWRAVVTRSTAADGVFFYGVVTTGVYCRPSCASRIPNRQNVRFFDTVEQAEGGGYRACKRCTPRHPSPSAARKQRDIVIQACRRIEAADEIPSLQQLAEEVGMSASRLHRRFKDAVGLTPKEYASAVRDQRLRERLVEGHSVTDAVHAAGFESSSRFYAQASSLLGMRASRYRTGGKQESIRFATTKTHLGWMLVAATEAGVCRVEFGDSPDALHERLKQCFPHAQISRAAGHVAEWMQQIVRHLEDPANRLDLPLDIQGTAFQRRVWRALQEIPLGERRTYGELAQSLGVPNAARAVGHACAANPVAVAIPCHRVLPKGGGLGGYRWGTQRKQSLLERESDAKSANS